MPVSPWWVGMTRPIWSIQQMQDAATPGGQQTPLPIAGSTIALHYKVTDPVTGLPTGNDIVGVNAGVITDGPNGKFTYTPDPTDTFVTTAGVYLMQWRFTFGTGLITDSDSFRLEVDAVE